MGKRVHVRLTPLTMTGPVGADGTAPVRNPGTASLSCGHGKPFKASFFTSSGDPAWCDECESSCLACGAPSTDCRTPSWEWGESCAACFALPESDWILAVRLRRERLLSEIAYGPCPVCSLPMTGAHAIVLIDNRDLERGGRGAHHKCWPTLRVDADRLLATLDARPRSDA